MMILESQARVRIVGALVLVGVFAAGAVFGAGLARWSQPGQPEQPTARELPPRRPPPGGPVPAMIHELQLDPAQIEALHQIERAHRGELDTIARETMPRVRAVLDAMEHDLEPQLRPEQLRLLEEWRKRRPPPPLLGVPRGPGGPGRRGPPPPHPPPPGVDDDRPDEP
jgi:uncharacterized membrane protein